MSTQIRDIANRAPDAYSRSAPIMLEDVHTRLKKYLSHLRTKSSPRVLVAVGPGEGVNPYSREYRNGALGRTNRASLSRLLGERGKFVLIDYVAENGRGLERARETLYENGFFERGFFIDTKDIIDVNSLHSLLSASDSSPTVGYAKGNLSDNITFPTEKADFVDMTLSMHHATKTRARLKKICQSCFDFLKPGGSLHIGEGNVDMNYIEDKLISFGQDVSSVLSSPALMLDLRGTVLEGALEERLKSTPLAEIKSPRPTMFYFIPGESYSDLPEVELAERPEIPHIIVSEGGITIPYNVLNKQKNKLINFLSQRGHNSIHFRPKSLVLPLINRESETDRREFLRPIAQFYAEIKARADEIHSHDQALFNYIREAIEEEHDRAACGDTEHYIGREKIIKSLRNVGFENIEILCHKKEPFYNLIAQKPK